jgi:small subunit ribosomal protein S6
MKIVKNLAIGFTNIVLCGIITKNEFGLNSYLALLNKVKPIDQKEEKKMKKYEVMYIIRPEVEEDARKALIEEVNAIFTNNASAVENVNEWGLRELAYEIKGCKKGYYVLLNVNATVEAIDEFTRVANIKENIIRYIAVAE